MIAQELISPLIPPLNAYDALATAVEWMKEYHCPELPVVNGPVYKGLLFEEDLLDVENLYQKVGNLKINLKRPFVHENDHLFKIAQAFSLNQTHILPVLYADETYMGVITLQNVVQQLAKLDAVENSGGLITLEMPYNNYSLVELARIVEQNNANILSSFTQTINETGLLEVTLKVNVADLSSIIETFGRFGYNIKRTYQESKHNEILIERYDALMNYLNI